MDYNNPALTAKSRFAADGQAVRNALKTTREFIARAACGADAEARLCIIVEELVTNVIEHGEAPVDSEIGLELAAIGAEIGLTLTDEAMPFDIRTAATPAETPPQRGGGAGIALVLHWAQVIDYQRVDGRNVLKLVISNHV